MIKRRKLLLALGMLPAWAQLQAQTPARIHRIGILSASGRGASRANFEAFETGLRELGYVDGKNAVFEYRFADGKFERLQSLAAELVQLKPGVLLVHTTPANLAAKKATREIPIVMVGVADPVGVGLVPDLARPGGNITGMTNISAELAGKRLDLLKEILPQASRIAVIVNPGDANAQLQMRSATEAAVRLKIQLQPVVEVRAAEDLDRAFEAIVKGGARAAIRMVDPLGSSLRKQTADLAARHRLPVMYPFREDAEAGGLISYGTNLPDQFRRAAAFVDKILKGARPADLPVEQPTKFELVINLKTAKALGLTIPPSVLARADEVIE